MIEVNAQQVEQIETLRKKVNMRGGSKMQTRVIYELWPQLFGIRRVPNGCNKCAVNDVKAFIAKYDELVAAGDVKFLTDQQENNK